MRVTIVQPPYPRKGEALEVLKWQIDLLESIQAGSTDLVVFPENSNCTGYTSPENMIELIKNEGEEFVGAIRRTAKRVGCTIMSGLMTLDEKNVLRNQLVVFPPDEKEFAPYTKVHLVEPELAKGIVPGEGATGFEYRGVKYGAAICFDYYFPELFVVYAKQRIDVMIMSATASDDGEVMGIRHATLPVEGVQYHPESIGTPTGMQQLKNFLEGLA